MISIISDTHDNISNIQKAVKKFKEAKVDFAVHCGDMVAPATVKFFDGVKVKAVKGNCDGDIELETKKLEESGGEYLGESGELEYKGKKIGIYHGTNPIRLERMISSQHYDYILTGHTHKTRDETIGKTRIINPGAHYYGAENTIALLDTEKDTVKFIKLT